MSLTIVPCTADVITALRLLDDATTAHRKLDPAEGLQDAQLASGARLHIVHGDVARGGHLLVNIRKFTGVAFRSLGELVERDMLLRAAADPTWGLTPDPGGGGPGRPSGSGRLRD